MRTSFALLMLASLAACGEKEPPAAPDTQTQKPAAQTETAPAEMTQSESERITIWFNEKYEELLKTSPMQLTQLGRKERYGEWDEFTFEAAQEQADWYAETVAKMKSEFDYDALDAESKLSYDLWVYQAEDSARGMEFIRSQYVFDQMTGTHSIFPTVLIAFHRVDDASDMEAYISRVEGIETALSELVEGAKTNAEGGVHAPRFANEIVTTEIDKILTGAPFTDGPDADLFADGKAKIAALLEADKIDQDAADEMTARLSAAMTGPMKRGYEKVAAFLAEDLPNAPETATGVGGLPDGEAYYAYRLQNASTTNLTPDEVHAIGLDEVARIRGEMEKIMADVEFNGDLQAFFEEIRNAEWNYYPNTDEGRQAYIDDAVAALDNIEVELPNYFGLLPKGELEVKRVEPFREQDGAAQHYYPGTPDGSRPGIYYAHLSDMSTMPKNQLEVIAYHEGLPGHHMQIAISQELTDIPTFRTQYFSGAYVEGWALYSEILAKEMPNTYQDPYADFGRLTTEMWRAIRLVVDTGLHSKGWTEQEAIEYFSNNSPEPLESVRSEVRRYIVWPGQATSYKIGMIKIQDLRAKAEAELGDDFDIRGFHDAILGGGSLPLELLERRVDHWIDQSQNG